MIPTAGNRKANDGSIEPFAGFALPTSNTTYTPNQFFDVCLPHCSRGVVRLVGYMIRKTLGWCDSEGNPQHETVAVSYRELERNAGVSHSMVRQALVEAEAGGFIRCIRSGQASSKANSGAAAVYDLRWDEREQYLKDPRQFQGFFAGEGNRTYIPNQFFDQLLPGESLALIQVVGSIIRFSIGFANKYGHRRQQVALSYRDIQRYAKLASPRLVSASIRQAIARNYIQRVEEGYFDRDGGRLSRSAHYALRWAEAGLGSATTPKSEAGKIIIANHSEKVSGTAPKSEAADHSEKFSGIQIKQTNKTSKQQARRVERNIAVVEVFERLKAEGFDAVAARAIADRYPAERIHRQINWIDQRKIKANRLGMLRAAIDQDWADPMLITLSPGKKLGRPNPAGESGLSVAQALDRTRRRIEEGRS